jgi:hypothetical protein
MAGQRIQHADLALIVFCTAVRKSRSKAPLRIIPSLQAQASWGCSVQAAYGSVLQRVFSFASWQLRAYYVGAILVFLALLSWNAFGRRSYLRWWSAIQIVVRLLAFFVPAHRWVAFTAVQLSVVGVLPCRAR